MILKILSVLLQLPTFTQKEVQQPIKKSNKVYVCNPYVLIPEDKFWEKEF